MRNREVPRFFIPSLFFSQLATRPSGILTGFILLEISKTFYTSVGVTGQLFTASSILGMISAPILAVLSIRIKPKNLLLTGIALITISSVGCSISPSYFAMLFSFCLNGIGAAIVAPMIMTLIGENMSKDKRSGAIGIIIASTPMLSTLTGLVIGRITSLGWRTAYLIYVLPIALISLTLSFFGLRGVEKEKKTNQEKNIFDGFKMILENRSAIFCLLASSLAIAAWISVMYYGISFYRERYLVPTDKAGIIWSALAFSYTLGSLLTGRLVDRFGRKPVSIVSALMIGISTVLFTNIPSFAVSILFAILTSISAGLWQSVSNSFSLEQVPEFRGSMMSLNRGFISLGMALGSGIGGLALSFGDYNVLGICLGLLGIVASIVYYLHTHDPTME
jgi:predicted MFS family arabinose efflux permease